MKRMRIFALLVAILMLFQLTPATFANASTNVGGLNHEPVVKTNAVPAPKPADVTNDASDGQTRGAGYNYSFDGNAVDLSVILQELGLTGEVTAASSDYQTLLKVEKVEDAWKVSAVKPFSSTEDIRVTIGEEEHVIHVTNTATKTVWTELVDRKAPASDYAVVDEANKTVTVSTPLGLAWVAYMTNTSNEDWNWFDSWTIKLAGNIDLNGYLWEPIGNAATFDGSFDGCDYTVSNLRQNVYEQAQLYVGDSWSVGQYFGLFGRFTGVSVKNVIIDNFHIFSEYVTNSNTGVVGAVAGGAWRNVTFENITVKNCRLEGYNQGCACIVGWATGSAGADYVMTFSHITIDSSNIINPVYNAGDTPMACILGSQGVPSSGSFKTSFDNCELSAQVMQLNDCTMAYDYWRYRNAGMLIGRISGVQPGADNFNPDQYIILGENVNVTYKDWNQEHYCEFNGLGIRGNHARIGGPDEHTYSETYQRDGHTIVLNDMDQHFHTDDEDHDIILVFDQLIGASTGGKGTRKIEGVNVTYYDTVNINQYPIWTWNDDCTKAEARFGEEGADGTTLLLDEEITIEDGKLIAKVVYDGDTYISTRNIYTVTFETNGGSAVEAQQVIEGKTASEPVTEKEHYDLLGWYSNEALTTPFDFNAPITSNVTVYAKWQGEICVIMYVNGMGSTLKRFIVHYGETTPAFTPDPLPTREGFNLDPNNLWTPAVAEIVTGDVSYALNWIELHVVSFDPDNGDDPWTVTVEHNGSLTKPEDPERSGYEFLGWFDGNNEFDFSKQIRDNYNLKAHWKINQYTVTFMDGETVIQSTTADYGTPITAPADPTKEGYVFLGWSVEVPATIPAEDLIINARWALGVARIGDTLYPSLAEAVTAAVEGDTVIMVANSEETNVSLVNKSITIDLNGKKVTREGTVINASADLIIVDNDTTGSGMISGTGSNGIGVGVIHGTTTLKSGTVKGVQYSLTATNDAALVIDGGEIVSEKRGILVDDNATLTFNGGELSSSSYGIDASHNIQIVINGGTIHSTSSSIAIVGYGGLAKLTINDGTILTDNGCCITSNFHRPDQEIVINGGTLKNLNKNNCAIYMPSVGRVTINGGYIEGDQAIDMRHGYLTITGGTIVGSDSNAVMIYSTCYGRNDPWNNADKEYGIQTPVVSISGGYFYGANGAEAVKVTQGSVTTGGVTYEGGVVEDFITGGFFTTAPDFAYCGVLDGDQLYPILSGIEEYPYTVGSPVAVVNNFGYSSVLDAKNARESDDDVITLLKNADYAFVAGDVLKIYKINDQIAFTYTVAEGLVLKISDPDAAGVVTYRVVGAVARIVDVLYATIDEAVAAANTDDVIEVIVPGDFTLPNLPKKVTIEGAVDGVVFNHTGTGNIAATGAGATFKNVTFNLGNNNYHGFQHNGGLTFENCTFNGKFFTYGNETYKGCTFNQTNSDYHMWVYGGNSTVVYDECTFVNTKTGKFLNVYNENGAPVDLTVRNCTFINEGSASKAAVNVKETAGSTSLQYNVKIFGGTTEGNFPESSETNTLVVGNSLWQVDDRLTNGTEPKVAVFLDGEQVYPVFRVSVSDGTNTTYFTRLHNAIPAANALSGNVTVTMLADDTVDVSGYALTIDSGKIITLDLNGKTVVGACTASGTSALIRNLGTLTIVDSSDPSTGKLIGGADPTWTWDGSDDYAGSYASNLIRNEGTLVINGGYLYNASTGSAAYAIDNYGSGKVTINGGTIDAKKASAIRLFYNNGGVVTVNGGSIGHYNSDDDCSYMGIQIMAGDNAVVNVNGGVVDGMYSVYGSAGVLNITDGTFPGYVGAGAGMTSISISGGKFGEWVGTWGSHTDFITGGVFAGAPDFEYCGYDSEGNQLYPMMNDDPETKEDYPYTVGIPVAIINGEFGYATLESAFAAAKDGDSIKLLRDASGNGIVVPQDKFASGLTVDFGGHTYTVDGTLVGSTGTENQAFQLLMGNNVTFKNGTIYSEKALFLVQNYSNLTLDGMTLTLNNANYASGYTLSNNNGNIVIKDTTINANPAGRFAFDVCRYATYPEVHVTVTGTSVINGDIEISASGNDALNGFSLMLESGTFSGKIVLDASAEAAIDATPDKAWVKRDKTAVEVQIPETYTWVDLEGNIQLLTKLVTVTFEADNGSEAQTVKVPKGQKVTKPEDPTKENYIFDGWYEEGSESAFDFDSAVTKDIVLKAKWEGVPVTIIYTDYFTGKILQKFEVHYGDAKDQYTFTATDKIESREGYHYDINDMWTIPVADTATEDIVYVLKWIKGIAVTFNPDNGEEAVVVIVDRDTKVEKPATDPQKTGYDFAGWYDGNNEYDFDTLVTASLYLTAKWTPKPMTVSFDTDGGSAIDAVVVDYDTAVAEPEAPAKEGYVFAGWTLNGEAYDFSAHVTGNITLVATWTEAVAKIGDEYFVTLADAFEAAIDGDTIVLLKDTKIESIEVGKKVTLDLAGYEVSSDRPMLFEVTADGDLTITGNGKITGPANGQNFDGKTLITVDGGKLTIENGTLTASGSGSDGMYGVYVLNGGTAIFGTEDGNGPTITSHFAAIGTNNTTGPATITVYGGTYTANATPNANDWWYYFCAPVYAVSNGNFDIKGGTFNGYYGISDRYSNVEQAVKLGNVTINASSGVQVFVDEQTGVPGSENRTVKATTNTLTVPEGYAWLKLADNEYLLVKAVAKVGDDYFATFEEAFAIDGVIGGEKVIKLLANGAEYEFQAGDILKVQKANGEITFVYTAVDGVLVSVSEPDENGVVTYSTVDPVAKIGNTYYATLKAAVRAAVDGDTVELLKDTTESFFVPDVDETITIDLGGHTMTGSLLIDDGPKVTVANGTINGTVYVYGGTSSNHNGLTVAADAVVGDGSFGIILYQAYGTAGPAGYGSTIDINGTVNGIVWVMGNITEGDSVINVNDGAKITGDDVGIALNGVATVNVYEGATVTGVSDTGTGIEVRAGTLNVYGGTITGEGTATAISSNGSGTTTTGAGIAIAQHTTGCDINVNIFGGTITGKTALSIANPEGITADNVAVAVTGGIFNGPVTVAESETRVEKFVSGGDFLETVKPEYVVEGKLCTTKLTETIDGTEYYYIVDAIKVTFDADNGSEVTVVEVPKGEPVGKPETDPKKTGFVFSGWFDVNNEYDFSKNVYEALTLKAHWTENEYDISYEWSDDNKTVTATAECTNNPEAETITETVNTTSEITTPATCETKGKTTYTATFTNTAFETQTKEVENVEALGHDWNAPTYEWAADNSSVTATRTCKNDPTHVETETVDTTSQITTAATCETKGKTTYTATFTNTAFETQTKVVEDVEALGHNYGTPTYTWSDDNKTVTATIVCQNNNAHTITETANATFATLKAATCEAAGEGLWIAEFENELFRTQIKQVAIPATGHAYGEATYEWAADHSTVTATKVCANDSTHIITKTVTTTYEVITAATADEDGLGRYTATFEDPFETQTLDVVIPKLGHEDVKVTFDADGGTPAPEAQTIPYAGYAQKPADPERAGYIFDGWYLGEEKFDFATTQITENIILKAKWTEGVARIGSTLYATVADAVAAANTGDTIVLLKDVTENVIVEGGKDFTLDLGGHTLTGYIDQYDADVTIKNGTVKGTAYANGLADGKTGSLTINSDATIDSAYAIILYQAADGKTGNGFTVDINGTVNGIVWVMGNITEGNSVINVNDGAKITGDDVGIALNGVATVNVKEGATVTGTSATGTGIEVRAGTLNVYGGTITGEGTATAISSNGNGTTTTGAGIAIAQHTTGCDVNVNISGGTITGKTALSIANPEGISTDNVTVAVTGGIFNGPVTVAESETRVEKFVSGGDFLETVKPEYVVEGKLCTTKLTETIDGTEYYYIVDAIKVTFDANEGKFEADQTTIEVILPAGEKVTAVADPVRDDYSFIGWFVEDASEQFDFANTAITADIVLKARWLSHEYTVTVTSSGDGTPTPGGVTVAHVTGGGTYAVGDKVTVSAPAVTGYTFLGWYEVNGAKLSSEMTFVYTVREENNDLIAVYEPTAGATFRLTVTGSRFTINDGTVQRSRFDDYYTAGGTVTLKYTGSDKFLYWVNDAKKIVSTSPEYTFTLVADTIVDAVYSENDATDEALVLFVSAKNLGQVISQRYYTSEEAIVFPTAPVTMGKTFVGWDKSEEEIHALMATETRIIVYPVYESNGGEYIVTIEYWVEDAKKDLEQKDPLEVSTRIALSVDATYEGKNFSYWADNEGNILGYKADNLILRPTKDVTVRAVYGVEVEPKPVVRMTDAFASVNGDKTVLNFVATRSIPDGYTLERAGVLYAGLDRVSLEDAKDKLTLPYYDGEGHGYILEGPFVAADLDDAAMLYFSTKRLDRQFIVRAYIVVKDAEGELHYVYSDNVIYASYNELNNNEFHSVNIIE